MFNYNLWMYCIHVIRKVLRDPLLPLWYSCGFLTAFSLFTMFRLPYYGELMLFSTFVSLYGLWEMFTSMISRVYRIGIVVHRRTALIGVWGQILFPMLVVSELVSSFIRPFLLLFRPFFNLSVGSAIIGVVAILHLLGWLSFIVIIICLSSSYSFEWLVCVLQWYVMGAIILFSRWQ